MPEIEITRNAAAYRIGDIGRRITDRAELESLPVGAIVLEIGASGWESDPCPIVFQRIALEGNDLRWQEFGDTLDYDSDVVAVPVLVLWQPEVSADA